MEDSFMKKTFWTTAGGALAFGLMAHLFVLTNIIVNHDNARIHGYGSGVTSGRWFLSVLGELVGKVWGNYNIAFFNGFLGILMLAACAGMIAVMFGMKDPLMCVLWGGIFLCFPTVSATLFYMYTVAYYFIAVLMTVLGVFLTEKYKWGFIPAIVLAGCGMGIYQGYFPMMISLFVTLIIYKALFEKEDLAYYVKKAARYLAAMVGALLFYFIMLRVMLWHYRTALDTGYYNIDEMGQVNLKEIPEMIAAIYKGFFGMVTKDYYGMSATSFLRRGIALLGILSICFIMYAWITKEKRTGEKGTWYQKLILYAGLICYPFAINSITFMCYHSKIYTLTIYAGVLFYLLPMLLADRLLYTEAAGDKMQNLPAAGTDQQDQPNTSRKPGVKKILRWAVGGLCGLIMMNYIWLSNGNYTVIYYTDQITYHYMNSLLSRVTSAEGFDPSMKWAFIGRIQDPILTNPWKDSPFTYGGNKYELWNEYSRKRLIRIWLGYDIQFVPTSDANALKQLEEVKAMPCYPADGSVAIIDDVVIVKMQD